MADIDCESFKRSAFWLWFWPSYLDKTHFVSLHFFIPEELRGWRHTQAFLAAFKAHCLAGAKPVPRQQSILDSME